LSGFAVRVLTTDVRLHGRRFVTAEFTVAAVVSCALAVAVAVSAAVRGSGVEPAAVAVLFFVGVAANSVAVVRWVSTHAKEAAPGQGSLLDLGMFCAATLLPGGLVWALRPPR